MLGILLTEKEMVFLVLQFHGLLVIHKIANHPQFHNTPLRSVVPRFHVPRSVVLYLAFPLFLSSLFSRLGPFTMSSAITQFSAFLCNLLAGTTTQTRVNTILIFILTLNRLMACFIRSSIWGPHWRLFTVFVFYPTWRRISYVYLLDVSIASNLFPLSQCSITMLKKCFRCRWYFFYRVTFSKQLPS